MPRQRKDKNEQLPIYPHREQIDSLFVQYHKTLMARIRSAKRGENNPTLQTGDIMHDLYINLLEVEQLSFDDTRKVLNLLTIKARQYVTDRARKRNAQKRGGGILVPLSLAMNVGGTSSIDVLVLNDALDKLALESPRAAEIVRFYWFIGLNQVEIAELLRCDRSTVKRDLDFSMLWLTEALSLNSKEVLEDDTHDR